MKYEDMSRDDLLALCYKYKTSQQSLNNRYTKEVGRNIRLEGEVDELKSKNGTLTARNCQLTQKVARLEQSQGYGSYVKRDNPMSKEIERLENLCAKLYKILEGMGVNVDKKGNVIQKKSIWDTDKLLATVYKDVDEEIKFRLVGNDYGFFVDIRVFKYDKPTRKGLCVRPKLVQDISNALDIVMDMM